MGNNNLNWLIFFFRGVETTNQITGLHLNFHRGANEQILFYGTSVEVAEQVQLDAQVRWKNGEMAMKPGIWSGI